MVLFIRHIDSVFPSPILPARERGPSVFEQTNPPGGGCRAFDCSAWRFHAPSRPLRPCCPAAVGSTSGPRDQGGLYCQVAQESDQSSPSPSSGAESIHQRLGSRCHGRTTSRRSTPWVRTTLHANTLCDFNRCPIASPLKRWPKPTA